MSYAILALRLAAVEGLCPSAAIAGDKPFPTIAEKLVFDSRLRPLDVNEAKNRAASIFVYTDDADLLSGAGQGGPPYRALAQLVLVMIVAGPAAQEPLVEARLDGLGGQVLATLFFGPSASLWRKLTSQRVSKIDIETERSAEENSVILIRTMKLHCQIPFDCVDLNPATAPVGPDRVPEPLKSILAGLAATSYGKKIGLSLEAGAPVMPVLPTFDGMDVGFDVNSPPDGEPDVGLVMTFPQA